MNASKAPEVAILIAEETNPLLAEITEILDKMGISCQKTEENMTRQPMALLLVYTEAFAASTEANRKLDDYLNTCVPVIIVVDEGVTMPRRMLWATFPIIPRKDLNRLLETELQKLQARAEREACHRMEQRRDCCESIESPTELERRRQIEQELRKLEAMRQKNATMPPRPPMAPSMPPSMPAMPSMPPSASMPSMPPSPREVAPVTKGANKKEKSKVGFFARLFGKKEKEDSVVPPPTMDSVQFSAVAQRQFAPGQYIPVEIVMYEDAFRKVVDDLVAAQGSKSQEVKGGYQEVARNARVRVVLTSPDIPFGEDAEEREWKGKYLSFSFAVKVPDLFSQPQLLLTASVYINDLIATRLKLILSREKPVQVTREDVTSAFVSYASQDRNRVAAIIQGMKKARPDMDIFFDIESLRSGQSWEEMLWAEIDKRDVLFLCWSLSAKNSPWVEREWRYALEHKGETAIEPIPIDSPDICPPPQELQKKHFNDRMLYIIKATMPDLRQ